MVIVYVFTVETLSVALSRGGKTWKIREIPLRTDSVLLRVKADKSKNDKKNLKFLEVTESEQKLKESITCEIEYRAMKLKDFF